MQNVSTKQFFFPPEKNKCVWCHRKHILRASHTSGVHEFLVLASNVQCSDLILIKKKKNHIYIVSKQSRIWEKKTRMLAKNNRRAAHWLTGSDFSAVHRGLLRNGTDGNTGFILHCYRVHCQN